MMEGWTNPRFEPYVTKAEDVVCRGCNKIFRINAEYDKNGFPVSFRSKYCTECNEQLKEKYNNKSWGTINIESGKVPQRNVEGLEESIQTLATSIAHSQNATDESIGKLMDDFKAFKKHIEHNIEEKDFEFDIFKNVIEQVIKNNKLDVDVFKASQTEQNNTILEYINKIKTLLIALHIMVLGLFIFDLGVVWYIIKH